MPICGLADEKIKGFEILARQVNGDALLDPEQWLSEAISSVDSSQALAEFMLRCAFAALPRLPGDTFVTVNLEVHDMMKGRYDALLQQPEVLSYAPRLVIELSERGEMTDAAFEWCHSIQRLGFRLALDDVGSDHARIIELCDDAFSVVKFDQHFMEHLRSPHAAKRSRRMVEWLQSTGVETIMEHIETAEDLALAREVNFTMGQGFLFGPPASLEHYLGETADLRETVSATQ